MQSGVMDGIAGTSSLGAILSMKGMVAEVTVVCMLAIDCRPFCVPDEAALCMVPLFKKVGLCGPGEGVPADQFAGESGATGCPSSSEVRSRML